MESLERKESSKSPPKTTSNESNVASVVERLKNWTPSTFYYCVQCALRFNYEADYISHTKTEEHDLMCLVTGIAYTERDPDGPGRFPPLYYCVLCNVFCLDSNSYEFNHLKGIVHKQMVQFIRCISFWKENILAGMKCRKKEPLTAQDFEDLKSSPPHYCRLCDRQCNSAKTLENHTKGQMHTKLEQALRSCEFCNVSFVNFNYYQRHLNSNLHHRMKDFMIKMLIPQTEITGTPKRRSRGPLYAGVNHLPLLYYCKLCNMEFNDVESFRNHRKTSIHKRIQNLANRISLKQDNAPTHKEIDNQLDPHAHYCEVCNTWCINSYDDHVKTGSHQFNQSTEVVKKWDCLSENRSACPRPRRQ